MYSYNINTSYVFNEVNLFCLLEFNVILKIKKFEGTLLDLHYWYIYLMSCWTELDEDCYKKYPEYFTNRQNI